MKRKWGYDEQPDLIRVLRNPDGSYAIQRAQNYYRLAKALNIVERVEVYSLDELKVIEVWGYRGIRRYPELPPHIVKARERAEAKRRAKANETV